MQPGLFKSYFGAICVPTIDKGDGTVACVTHDWANAMASLGGGLAVTMMRLNVSNRNVAQAKQDLAERAIAHGCQFVFFADDDTIPPPDALMKMIQLWRMDSKYKIINGVYWSKSEPPLPLIFKGSFEGSYLDWKMGDLVEADGAGAGCTFIDTEVFKNMPKPWFSDQYIFQDVREGMDDYRWSLEDRLVKLLRKGTLTSEENDEVEKLKEDLKKQSIGMNQAALEKGIDPTMLYNLKNSGGATEDLYFYKKAKEVLGLSCWVDTSIQCQHQDKRTGRMFGIRPDFPQADRSKFQPVKNGKTILDIGCGEHGPHFQEFDKVIRLDIDKSVDPDICCDARQIPLEDCSVDAVHTSHILEHFSFKWTKNVLKEWIRLIKIGGDITIIVPNLEWSADKILRMANGEVFDQGTSERAMFMYFSAQKDGGKEDFHKAGFTPKSMYDLLSSFNTLTDVKVVTSDGGYGNYMDAGIRDGNYNIVATAKKIKHESPVSIHKNLNILDQEEVKYTNPFAYDEKPKKEVVEKSKEVAKKKASKK